jgi:hypothetical protein
MNQARDSPRCYDSLGCADTGSQGTDQESRWTALERRRGRGQRGRVGSELVLIVEGSVRVVHVESDGSERLLRPYEAGDHFGELVVLREAPRAATVIAEPPGIRGLVIGGQGLTAILRERPDAAMAMLATLATRISQGYDAHGPDRFDLPTGAVRFRNRRTYQLSTQPSWREKPDSGLEVQPAAARGNGARTLRGQTYRLFHTQNRRNHQLYGRDCSSGRQEQRDGPFRVGTRIVL